jgi:hypothetical protein
MPKRIQRKRVKGWRMPTNTVYVGRPSRHGNPFKVGVHGTREECIEKYKTWAAMRAEVIKQELRGKDLACFCRLDQACHADVLLALCNE